MKRNNISNITNLASYSNIKRKTIFKNSKNHINYEPINKTLSCSIKQNKSPTQLKKSHQNKKRNILSDTKYIHSNSNQNLNILTERSIKKEMPKNNIEISLSSVNSNENKILSSRSNSFSKYQYKEIVKSQDEIFELKLQYVRLQNENKILTEKNKSLNNILEMKNTENELLTNKYSNLISDLKQDNLYLKEKYERDIKNIKEMNEKQIVVIKSLINFSIEVFELLMNISFNNIYQKNTLNQSQSNCKSINNSRNNNTAELSIDIFDSNGNDEEKKIILIEQIKDLFLSKINSIKKLLNINIDTSFFEKLKELSSLKNNYSNIMNSVKKNNNDEFNISLSKSCFNLNDNSNDFDLSVSKSFYNITNNTNNNISSSPKFNSFSDNSKENKNEKLNNDNNNFSLMLLSETKSLKGSFGEYSYNSNGINKKYENENSNKQNINILDYSIGDIVNNGNNENNEEVKEDKLLYKIDSLANIKCGEEKNSE